MTLIIGFFTAVDSDGHHVANIKGPHRPVFRPYGLRVSAMILKISIMSVTHLHSPLQNQSEGEKHRAPSELAASGKKAGAPLSDGIYFFTTFSTINTKN